MLFNLVEKTSGPWHGKVWRSEEMEPAEAERRNGQIEVMKWEPAERSDETTNPSRQRAAQSRRK